MRACVCAVNQSLQHLDVSGASLNTLTVRTQTLASLAARACPHLEAVRLAVPPRHCDMHNCRLLRSLDVTQTHGADSGAVAEVEIGGCDSLHSSALSLVKMWAPTVRVTA